VTKKTLKTSKNKKRRQVRGFRVTGVETPCKTAREQEESSCSRRNGRGKKKTTVDKWKLWQLRWSTAAKRIVLEKEEKTSTCLKETELASRRPAPESRKKKRWRDSCGIGETLGGKRGVSRFGGRVEQPMLCR